MKSLASNLPIVSRAPDRAPINMADIVGRSLLILLMLVIASGGWQRMAASAPGIGSLSGLLIFLGALGGFAFAMLVGALTLIRLPACRTATGWAPVISALSGTLVINLLNLLPNASLPVGLSSLSVALLALGNLGTVYCLIHLGRSFSILPQARALVRTGPYAHLRHPLYVAEGIATLGMIVSHLGWVAIAIGFAQFSLQWKRVRYEEQILRATFPDYAGYAAVTPRFVPRKRRENVNIVQQQTEHH